MEKSYRPNKSDLLWHRTVAKTIDKRLGWLSAYALKELLNGDNLAYENGAIQIAFYGNPDCFGNGWTIEGGCHYGSRVFCDPKTIMVLSCGGHWVEARRIGGNDVRFMTDRRESTQSWGDSLEAGDPYGDTPAEKLETLGFTSKTGAELEYVRAQGLERGYLLAISQQE